MVAYLQLDCVERSLVLSWPASPRRALDPPRRSSARSAVVTDPLHESACDARRARLDIRRPLLPVRFADMVRLRGALPRLRAAPTTAPSCPERRSGPINGRTLATRPG